MLLAVPFSSSIWFFDVSVTVPVPAVMVPTLRPPPAEVSVTEPLLVAIEEMPRSPTPFVREKFPDEVMAPPTVPTLLVELFRETDPPAALAVRVWLTTVPAAD
jgi:hypothetical protein